MNVQVGLGNQEEVVRTSIHLSAVPSVAKEKMEPVGNGNEFCGTL